MTANLQLRNLTKNYGASLAPAVDSVSLSIASGELVSLLGPSGCGKTTTLRMIAGLVLQDSGDITINGESIANRPVHERNIGMVFQNYALFPHMTIHDNVAFGLRMRSFKAAERDRRVSEALEIVQLGSFAQRTPAELSGGQQQRVALARALVIEPSVLLLDEPLGALDKNLREDMQVELRRIQKSLGITTVIVTHDQEEALTLSDRVVVMKGGKLEQVGTPRDVYCRPESRFVAEFIGSSNFLEGTVQAHDNKHAVVEAGAFGLLKVDRPLAEGARISVALRPEDIELLPLETASSSEPYNCVRCSISEVLYKGFVSHIYAKTAEGQLIKVSVQNKVGHSEMTKYSPGQTYLAHWPIESNIVLK
ncbi:ABC transporter ATP-binding protein [Pseudomonas sp. C2L12B]|uniref:Spermidine/putrescine import ATP-binding protein PotA n=1 Tax=Pseudomonas typographi TaxID=2715964 RepID=A0ABR7Z4R6_9PSED|nr:ABC transporter ATP-binding protein [Pseudomonas typographi]MBD1588429.1 ABC transporter ATP-binding protein [Pseudomonas typographi]MBD1600496.1 ABC transporter ATP-binding protein [Pseudomonas typographi]